MAYMNQTKKSVIKVALDAVLKDTGIRYTLAVRHHSTLVCTLKSGPIDFIGEVMKMREARGDEPGKAPTSLDVNPYHPHLMFEGQTLDLVKQILGALNMGNHDNSDPMSDYFDVGWYIDLNIGTWEKPYVCTK